MPSLARRTECKGQHWLHPGIMDAYKSRHTHDQHTLFIYINEKYRYPHPGIVLCRDTRRHGSHAVSGIDQADAVARILRSEFMHAL